MSKSSTQKPENEVSADTIIDKEVLRNKAISVLQAIHTAEYVQGVAYSPEDPVMVANIQFGMDISPDEMLCFSRLIFEQAKIEKCKHRFHYVLPDEEKGNFNSTKLYVNADPAELSNFKRVVNHALDKVKAESVQLEMPKPANQISSSTSRQGAIMPDRQMISNLHSFIAFCTKSSGMEIPMQNGSKSAAIDVSTYFIPAMNVMNIHANPSQAFQKAKNLFHYLLPALRESFGTSITNDMMISRTEKGKILLLIPNASTPEEIPDLFNTNLTRITDNINKRYAEPPKQQLQ